MQKKALSKILRIVWGIAAPSDERIQRIPINPAQLGQSSLTIRRLALRGNHHKSPPRRMKLSPSASAWVKFRFHDAPSLRKIPKRRGNRNKNLRIRQPARVL